MFPGWFESHSLAHATLPRLSQPEPHAGCHPGTLTRPAELKRWLSSLPNASARTTCRQLTEQLRRLSRYPAALPKLPALLGVLEPAFEQLAEQIDTLIRVELHSTEQRLFDGQVQAFGEANLELAHLQKRLINDTLDAGRDPSVQSVYSAMRTLSRQLRLDLSGYHRTPPGPWRDVLALYQIAEFLELADLPVELTEPAAPDVHSLFFGTLLFQLTDPLRLPHPQGWLIYAEALSAGADMDFATPSVVEPTVRIDLEGAVPPLASARAPSDRTPPQGRDLPLGELLHRLEGAAATAQASLLLAPLRRLIAEMASGEARRHARFPCSASYVMFAGLGAVHACLTRAAALRAPATAQPPRVAQVAYAAPRPQQDPPAGIPCEQLNQSRSGAAFLVAHTRAAAVQIGDLVLFENAADKVQGRAMGFVARVRRLLLREEQDAFEIGVEKVDGRLLPVTVKTGTRQTQALLCQAGEDHGLQLFGSTDMLATGAVLEVSGPTSTFVLRVTDQQERTGSLARVTVTRVDRPD